MIEPGFCQCGCGERTKQTHRTRGKEGYKKGDYKKFLAGHNWKGVKRKKETKEITDSNGYIRVYDPINHANATHKYSKKHRMIAEKVLGRKLKQTECVHHFNEKKQENANSNMVICTMSFHHTIHLRTRAFYATGNPNYRKCLYCKEWDNPSSLYITPSGAGVWHRSCYNKYRNQYNAIHGRS